MGYTSTPDISYTQVVVCIANMEHPFNDWTREHFNQGFSWRNGSVSFGTFNSGLCNITIEAKKNWEPNPSAERIIVVPFEVADDGIEVISTEAKLFDIPAGKYELFFSAIPSLTDENKDMYEICFVPNNEPQARILKCDDQLSPPDSLLMEAQPAQ